MLIDWIVLLIVSMFHVHCLFQDVIRYSLMDVITNEVARDHFYLHPDNGQIWLVKSLTDVVQPQFAVSTR